MIRLLVSVAYSLTYILILLTCIQIICYSLNVQIESGVRDGLSFTGVVAFLFGIPAFYSDDLLGTIAFPAKEVKNE